MVDMSSTAHSPTSTRTATRTSSASAPGPSSQTSLADLASATKSDRNRAVDFYRAMAMLAVAYGHWAAIHIAQDSSGALIAGNALEFAPSMSWITWIFQVMPLFFVVGGFSSAISLDSHNRAGGRPQDWVAARLRRMLAPTIVLASTWLGIMALGQLAGVGNLAFQGAIAAAIPLWFLANYTIDTAIAPTVLPFFRRHPALVAIGGSFTFVGFEVVRFMGHHTIAQINWVLGWLLFQIAGFAWRDGLLPAGRRMIALAGGFWAAALVAVFGPYPVSMVHFPGLENSPTHPPSIALMLFGAAYSATAIAAAPAISAWLARSPRAWAATIAANASSLTVYLWHFSAAVAAAAVFYAFGWLPTAEVNTLAWWLQKLPLIGLSTVFLAGIVAALGRFERKALLAPRVPWRGSHASIIGVALIVSTAVKLWTFGHPIAVVAGAGALVLVWFSALASRK